MSGDIPARIASVRARVARAAVRAGRAPADVTLVGASKHKPAADLVAAVRNGLGHVGESYVQEAAAKLAEARAALEHPGEKAPCFHFIGLLQRNKAGAAAELFDVIETVDRASLGDALNRRAGEAGRQLEVLLQVNVSGEAQKGGVAPQDLPALAAHARRWEHVTVTGLMTIPAAASDPERQRPAFAKLRGLRDTLRAETGNAGLRHLSMGMSGDFEVAIEEGATIVRLGTAIFGSREAAPPDSASG